LALKIFFYLFKVKIEIELEVKLKLKVKPIFMINTSVKGQAAYMII